MTDSATPHASQPLPASAWTVAGNQKVIRIAGAGTDKFLQGQFSQNLADVTATFSPRAAASTPKGRAYCLTRLVRDGDDVLMTVPEALLDDITAQLRKYLMLFRGTSMAVLDNARVIGILGEDLAERLGADVSALSDAGASIMLDQHHLIRTESTAEGQPRYELWQIGELPHAVAQVLSADCQTTPTDWLAAEIAAGIASLTPETTGAYVPQMLNWQHVGGIHFRKGCYTGQEVIARMHFLGQLKKSLFRYATGKVTTAPDPGTAIVSGDKPVGEIVNSVRLADGTSQCLAVVRHTAANSALHLQSSPEEPLHRLALPYAVPEQDSAADSDT